MLRQSWKSSRVFSGPVLPHPVLEEDIFGHIWATSVSPIKQSLYISYPRLPRHSQQVNTNICGEHFLHMEAY